MFANILPFFFMTYENEGQRIKFDKNGLKQPKQQKTIRKYQNCQMKQLEKAKVVKNGSKRLWWNWPRGRASQSDPF